MNTTDKIKRAMRSYLNPITHRVTLTANTDPNDPKYQLLTLRLTTGKTYTCAIEHSMCLDETAKALEDAAAWLQEEMQTSGDKRVATFNIRRTTQGD